MQKVYFQLPYSIQLLYWFYFRPYSLYFYLLDIHPDLRNYTNPFALHTQDEKNKELLKYSKTSLILVLLIPIIFTTFTAIFYQAFSERAFHWLQSSSLYIGWIISILTKNKLQLKPLNRISITSLLGYSMFFFGFFCLLSLSFGFMLSIQIDSLSMSLFCLLLGLFLGWIWGLNFGVTFGVGIGLFSGITIGSASLYEYQNFGLVEILIPAITSGLAINSIVNVILFFERNFTLYAGLGYMLLCLYPSIVFTQSFFGGNLFLLILFFVVFALSAFRFCFWFIEFLWILVIAWFRLQNNTFPILTKIPTFFDEFIFFPLPFIKGFIVDSYVQNPILTQKKIR